MLHCCKASSKCEEEGREEINSVNFIVQPFTYGVLLGPINKVQPIIERPWWIFICLIKNI